MASLKEIWHKYSNGKASLTEKKILYQAIENNAPELNEVLTEHWDKTKPGPVIYDEKSKSWKAVVSQIGLNKSKKINIYRLGVAASITILLTAFIFLYLIQPNKYVELEVATGANVQEIKLPDGTTVWLNHGSSLSYPTEFGSDSRAVSLTGNAFFEVIKDASRPFLINTNDINIKVLGTSFDVYSFKGESSTVSVRSGKVEVSHPDTKTKITLEKNEQTRFDSTFKRLTKTQIDIEKNIAWRDDILNFDNLRLSKAIKQIERKYGVMIICKDAKLMESRVRAIYKNEPLENVLSDLTFLTNSSYEIIKQNEIVIKPN